MLSRRCRRILLHVRIWTILLSTKRLQRPDILQEKGLAHISPFPLPVRNNDAHTAQLYMAKGLLGRHHTRLLVSSHTPIYVRLVCIRHCATLCRISGIFAMVCRTAEISHSYGSRHRSGLNQHLRRVFHGAAPRRIQPIHISCRTHAYILHRHLCRMATATAKHQTSTQQNQSRLSRRIMHHPGTIQHGHQPIRFHDHAQHRTALSAVHIDCARRLRIIRTVVPQNGKAHHYPFPSQNIATCRSMHTRGLSANRHNLSLQHNSSPKPRHHQSYSKDFNSSVYAAVSMGHSHLYKIHHEQNTIKP